MSVPDRDGAVRSTGSADGRRQLEVFLMFGISLNKSQRARLREHLTDSNATTRDLAAQALGAAHDRESFEALLKLLATQRPRDSLGIAWAIAEIGKAEPDAREQALDAVSRYRLRARGHARAHAQELVRGLAVIPRHVVDE